MNLETINLVIIAIAGVLILVTAYVKRDKNLVTVIGILGTFIGIILGLISFDTADISGSIAGLLNGLKTAFITSIFGLTMALILGFLEKRDESKDESDYLIEIRDEIKKLNPTGGNKSEKKHKSKDKEILEELKQLNSNNSKLHKAFDSFSREMAENNMKALVDAIGKVMKDFNTNINSQLGQSFKELSSGIENMLTWQKEYKSQIESSTGSLKKSGDSLEKASGLLTVVAQNSQNFSSVSQQLSGTVTDLNDSLKIFKKGASEFEGVSKGMKEMSHDIIQTVNTLSISFVQKAERIIAENEKQITTMTSIFSAQSSDLTEAHTDILTRMKKEINANSKILSDQFLRVGVRLEQQVQNLDEQLGRELEKSLSSLGQQLTSLSGKFVTDYGELADRLEKLSKK